MDEKGTTGTRGEGKNIWLGLDIYWEDIWVCLGLPFMFFFVVVAVVSLLPCGANGDSMRVTSKRTLAAQMD